MYIGLHDVAQSRVDEPVTGDSIQVGESVRHDRHFEMPFAFSCSGMTCMKVALVLHLDVGWRQRIAQPALDDL